MTVEELQSLMDDSAMQVFFAENVAAVTDRQGLVQQVSTSVNSLEQAFCAHKPAQKNCMNLACFSMHATR